MGRASHGLRVGSVPQRHGRTGPDSVMLRRRTERGESRVIAQRMHKHHIDVMAKSITIRNVPDETSEELAARAARSGRSLQEYLRAELIDLARRPDPEVLVARIRERKARTGSRLSVDSILDHRGEDRR